MDTGLIQKSYDIAKEKYAALGVNTEEVLSKLEKISISMNCWQGDDVGGFETPDAELGGGGIQVTGNFPGKPRNVEELRRDMEMAYSQIPGNHRLNLHSIYGEFGGQYVDRDQYEPTHFQGWIDWAKQQNLKLDFNCTCFSHPKAEDGYTLSSKSKETRDFWIEHTKRCRRISAHIGKELNSPCIHNLWIPDGSKDNPVDRFGHRKLLVESLDNIFSEQLSALEMKDAVECKLFGIGSEAFVVGSHEFYLGYAISRNKMICFDLGHFHPTELVADKISAALQFVDELLIHTSRGVRWDSDHVVILNDDVRMLTEEIVRSNALEKVNIALDFFDASINRIGAWAVGTRSTIKALLLAMLEPRQKLLEYENNGQLFERLALLEEMKTMPFGDVWNYYCMTKEAPAGTQLIDNIRKYEQDVLGNRG